MPKHFSPTQSFVTSLRRVAFAALLFLTASPEAAPFSLTGTIYEEVGREKDLDPKILYAVTLAESAYSKKFDGTAAPYPWVLRFPEGPKYFDSREDAAAALRRYLDAGKNAVDIGLSQINCRWHCRRVARPEMLLEPATNLRIAADILNEELARKPSSLISALGRYHSRSLDRSNRYGLTVLNIYWSLSSPDLIQSDELPEPRTRR